ncbi:hypothetical protein ACLVWU_13305 [Bdellovibrio sp. HCB290]|uniref:hypothetical protein n=1 Tax=Bdellovibrio sp. HCB290 TaxID=3394356 RepID=UPI0039B3A444
MQTHVWRNAFLLLSVLFTLLSTAQAVPINGEEQFIFKLGYFLPSFDTTLRVNNEQLGRGDEVSLENELGIDREETTIRGSVMWRISERNKLSLDIFNLNRSGTKTINRQIQIGDQIYPVGASLTSKFTFTIIPIAWSYAFIKNSDWEVSAGAGLQWSVINLKIDGSASLSPISTSREATADANAPLPLINADMKYYINPDWNVGANIGAFTYKVGAANMTMQGDILSAGASTEWWFTDYFGVGGAVNWFYIGVTVDGSKWDGEFNYTYFGPQAYLSARF